MAISGWELTERDNKLSYSYTGLCNLSENQNKNAEFECKKGGFYTCKPN